MAERPYTILSCAMSIDGYIAGPAGEPLALSNAADFDRVDAVRASCDAILVGAGTIRADQPRLVVRSEERQAERLALGLGATPIKVTVTGGGELNPCAPFFTAGEVEKLVYCAGPVVAEVRLASVRWRPSSMAVSRSISTGFAGTSGVAEYGG